MNKRALAFGLGASLLLAAGAANAGTCSGEIEQLSQSLGVPSDSPNANAGGGANTGVQQPSPTASADTSAATGTSGDATVTMDSDVTANAADPTGKSGIQQPDPGAEAAANADAAAQATSNGTTIAPDANESVEAKTGVQQPDGGGSDTLAQSDSSNAGSSATLPSPTVTETSRVGEMNTSAGGRASALVALEKARSYDQMGQEEACMAEIGIAKQQLGIQ